jgi:beta-lactamase regulating signal transducer with metallopeptidase domain
VIALWMLYCLGIGLAFVVVGHALERALHFAGRPTRWAWVIALAGSYVVPIAAWVRPDAFATFAVPIPVVAESGPVLPTSTSSTTRDQPPPSAFSLTDLDPALRWGWGLASVAMLLVLAAATARLVSQRRRWRQAAVDGRLILVSENIGPAVVGVWGPRVVLPEWALALPAHDRELMLAHEEQHVRASDPVLLAAGFLALLLAPWNAALWWQWRRLRLAVEMDCDARVLAQGRSTAAYGELLLEVGRRRATHLLGAAAFGEPASFLESRIRRILSRVPRWRWAAVMVALGVAVGAIIGACEAPRPLGPTNALQEPQAPSSFGMVDVMSGSDIHALVRPPIKADKAIQALQPPAVVYVWFQAMPDGRIVAHGRDDSRANLIRHAAGMGRIKTQGFAPAGVLAPAKVVYALVEVPWSQLSDSMTDRMTLREAERLRSWVESNARRMFPSILEPNGPPMSAFLVHDSRLRVYRGALTTLNYRGPSGSRPDTDIDVAELKRALPSFNPGHDGWAVIDPRGLRGLVRENVRVIRIHHDPEPQDTAVSSGGLSDQEMNRRAQQVRRLARQYHPEMFGQSRSQVAIALVLDSHETVVAHAARAAEARAAGDGVYASGESCLDVLNRLTPQYKTAQWSQSGCAVEKGTNVIVYWGQLMKP